MKKLVLPRITSWFENNSTNFNSQLHGDHNNNNNKNYEANDDVKIKQNLEEKGDRNNVKEEIHEALCDDLIND